MVQETGQRRRKIRAGRNERTSIGGREMDFVERREMVPMDRLYRQQRWEARRRRRKNQIIRRCVCGAMGIFAAILVIRGITGPKRIQQQVKEPEQYAAASGSERGMQVLSYPEAEEEKEHVPCIVLDAGHGGKDPGTLWGDIYEKDINLAIAKKLEHILTEKGYRVVMTRDGDDRVVLKERVRIAQESNADAFVSIHQNALEGDTVTEGMEIYCSKAKNPRSEDLSNDIWDSLLANTGARDKGMTTDSDLYVLDNTTVPACLIETGFITSSRERELLLDGEYQQRIAEGIAEGIVKFLG